MPYGTVNADLMTTSDGVSSSGLYGFKNRIINGAMVIDQRNAGASVTITTANQYTLDRWQSFDTQASKFSVQQNAGSVTPPVGFTKYLGVTSLSAYSVSAGDIFGVVQAIEGLNIADLAWGTANAATVTLSFKVYSSLTGTFGGSVTNGSANRSYPFTYTVSSANTWTSVSITIPGDTTGTWATDTSAGMYIVLGIGGGSTYSGTAGAWASGAKYTATGAVSVVGTNGATFYITGVQLEKGSTATSFDFRSYGTELALCQRYCTVFGGNATYEVFCSMFMANTSVGIGQLILPTPMRSVPTLTSASAGNYRVYQGNSAPTASAIGNNSYPSNTVYDITATISGGTTGYGGQLQSNNTTNNKLIFSAEL